MPSRATSRSATAKREEAPPLTAWGAWLRTQPEGTLTRAWRRTGLSWTTVNKAKRRLVTHESAVELARFARGAFKVSDMTKPSRAAKKRQEAA